MNSRSGLCVLAALVLAGGCAHAAPPSAGNQVPSLAATVAAMPKNLPRAVAPGLDEAMAAARATVRACAARGAAISALVTDIEARPVVLLSGDGAGYRSALIAQTKANIVARWHRSSGGVADQARREPALVAAADADPGIGTLRGGGLPVYRAGEWIGIVAVSGASLGNGDLTLDEQCARVGVAALERP
jgi:uncharacterized protein GlcG (DUF336 family)